MVVRDRNYSFDRVAKEKRVTFDPKYQVSKYLSIYLS